MRCAMCDIQDHDLLLRVVSWRVHWPRGEDGGMAWVATNFPGREISSVLRGYRGAGRDDRLSGWMGMEDGWMGDAYLYICPVGVAQEAKLECRRRRGNVPRTAPPSPFLPPSKVQSSPASSFLDRLLFVSISGSRCPVCLVMQMPMITIGGPEVRGQRVRRVSLFLFFFLFLSRRQIDARGRRVSKAKRGGGGD